MTVMSGLLERFGLTESEFAEAVSQAVADLPSEGSAALTADEARVLSGAGLEFGTPANEAGHRAHRNALVEQAALISGPSTAEVAQTMRVSESRIRHQAAAGTLLAIRVGRGLRFPAFQFGAEGRPLPGLGQVLAALPGTWPPAQAAAFFATPQPELVGGDGASPVTPAVWLAGGGDPAAVVALLGASWM